MPVPGAERVMPWDLPALCAPPPYELTTACVEEGVQALFYAGLPWQGRDTRVFAWYGTPATPGPWPAMVLVHGGGGTAFAEWVRLWTARGYAAIAMDTCGCIPQGEYGNWTRHAEGGPAGWGGFDQVDASPVDQWPYHAVADVVLAHSLLRTLPGVDAARIGITGISWGGYLTCITAGVDTRFACAVPVYGCGFLGEDSTWLPTFAEMGPERAARWLGQWDPSVYLPFARQPMLWVTGTNDFAYPMGSLRKSYGLPGGPRTLCIRLNMPHGHGGPGENPEEIRLFAESHLRDGTPLPAITAQGVDGEELWLRYTSSVAISRAEVIFTRDAGPWAPRVWESAEATLDRSAGSAHAAIPPAATACYLNLEDARGAVVSSEHIDRSPR